MRVLLFILCTFLFNSIRKLIFSFGFFVDVVRVSAMRKPVGEASALVLSATHGIIPSILQLFVLIFTIIIGSISIYVEKPRVLEKYPPLQLMVF